MKEEQKKTEEQAVDVEAISLTSPALQHQSEHYPASWHGKVPRVVRMAKTVTDDFPFGEKIVCQNEYEYHVVVNSHGAVAAILGERARLGLKPYEFEIIAFH